MYAPKVINDLVSFIQSQDGKLNKNNLINVVQERYDLTKERSVYTNDYFSIRFSSSKSRSFSNTVLALSNLRKYDDKPVISCLVTPGKNYLYLINSTFINKISHSAQELRVDNIRGSFNGSDIAKVFQELENKPECFEELFAIHQGFTFEENLERLVEAANNIRPTGRKKAFSDEEIINIRNSVQRTIEFFQSGLDNHIKNVLDTKLTAVRDSILLASRTDNVNKRGRIIEYLITEDKAATDELKVALNQGLNLPEIFTSHGLGDFDKTVARYKTSTDIKSKMTYLNGNPKAYNIDKFLKFLAEKDTVYLIYLVFIDHQGRITTRLCSAFHNQIRKNTRVLKHWSGRNSRGVTQYDGSSLLEMKQYWDASIDIQESIHFLDHLIHL